MVKKKKRGRNSLPIGKCVKEDAAAKRKAYRWRKMSNARALDLETPCPVSVKEKGRRGEVEPSRRVGKKRRTRKCIYI